MLRDGPRYVIGLDEVGRGALAGPVSVGAAVVALETRTAPQGIRDSKLLTAARREQLAPLAVRWAIASAVGSATNDEIDDRGISTALGLAGARSVVAVLESGIPADDAVVLLDGSWDYLSAGLAAIGAPALVVRTRVKADRDCASVAAASVIAKVGRDAVMTVAHDTHPHYAWAANKGYGAPAHWAGLRGHGPCALHRRTWLRALEGPLDGTAARID